MSLIVSLGICSNAPAHNGFSRGGYGHRQSFYGHYQFQSYYQPSYYQQSYYAPAYCPPVVNYVQPAPSVVILDRPQLMIRPEVQPQPQPYPDYQTPTPQPYPDYNTPGEKPPAAAPVKKPSDAKPPEGKPTGETLTEEQIDAHLKRGGTVEIRLVDGKAVVTAK